ncbi:MAG: tyrosine-type recombinase/integrase [Deltaproteobacteria bacterium]|nr:tyrosine-type recombinase/integrase [Candidatus Anaeroferrophillus wilburensis]MBN2889680.1 tyrosine-type recombinase/integrase [Deltaproteobacteria bacterium]
MKKFLQGSSSWCRSAQDFLSEMEKNDYAPATITTYKLHLSRLVPLVNGKTIKDINGHDLNAAIKKLRKMYPGSYQRPSSVNLLKNCCKAFFKWKSSYCKSENPAMFIRARGGVISETMPIFPKEIQRLLETIRTSEDFYKERDEALFATYAYTGLRRAEALTLRMANYQSEKALLKVVSKGGGSRWIPVIKPLKAILDRYLDNGNRQSKTWFLFTGRSNTRALSCRQANNRFVKWRKISSLPEYLTIHSPPVSEFMTQKQE